MPATLILMRHSQAVDRMEAEDDFQRGLTRRGQSDTDEAAAAMAEAGLRAELALVSPSWRTQETYRRLAETMGAPPIEEPMALYHASTDMLERAAMDGFSRATSIIMVGHNPGIGGFAHKLAAIGGRMDAMPRGYPTASVTAFTLDPETLANPELIFVHDRKA